jgi:hypothetical protein
MAWGEMGALILVGGLGLWAGDKAAKSVAQKVLREVLRSQAHDRMNYLNTLRRELANYLIWHDPDRYFTLYRLIHAETSAIKDFDQAKCLEKRMKLCRKYENYNDFDLIQTCDYVLYSDVFSDRDVEQIEEYYKDIYLLQAYNITCDKDAWRFFTLTSDEELKHLKRYVQRIKDTKLRLAIERAVEERRIWELGQGSFDLERFESEDFESNEFIVRRLSHYAENRFGVRVKKTNEYGIYGSFVNDNGKTYQSYYRSDSSFDKEEYLDCLHGTLKDKKRRI